MICDADLFCPNIRFVASSSSSLSLVSSASAAASAALLSSISSSEKIAPGLADASAFMRATISAAVFDCNLVNVEVGVVCEQTRLDVNEFDDSFFASFESKAAFRMAGRRGAGTLSISSPRLLFVEECREGRMVRLISTRFRALSFRVRLPGSGLVGVRLSETRCRLDGALDGPGLRRVRLGTISELLSDTLIDDLGEIVLGVIVSEETSTVIDDLACLSFSTLEIGSTPFRTESAVPFP